MEISQYHRQRVLIKFFYEDTCDYKDFPGVFMTSDRTFFVSSDRNYYDGHVFEFIEEPMQLVAKPKLRRVNLEVDMRAIQLKYTSIPHLLFENDS